MVPGAAWAHLDHVAIKVTALACQLGEVPTGSHAAPAGGQAVTENIRNMPKLHVLTNWALLPRTLPGANCGPQELRVRVAHLHSGELAPFVLAHDQVAREAVVDRTQELQRHPGTRYFPGHRPHSHRTVTAHNSTGGTTVACCWAI
jgi:hypothetical protein